MKPLNDLTDRELDICIVYSSLDDIINNCERMSSGNFMHNRAAIMLMAKNAKSALLRLGIDEIK